MQQLSVILEQLTPLLVFVGYVALFRVLIWIAER